MARSLQSLWQLRVDVLDGGTSIGYLMVNNL